MRMLDPGGSQVSGLVIILVLLVYDGHGATEEFKVPMNHTESACFSPNPEDGATNSTFKKVLSAQCPLGYMVYIVDLFYGHSTAGVCTYRPKDCTLSDFVTPNCIGRQKCEINLPSERLGRQIPHCRKYSNYMQLVYRCIPEIEVYDICTAGTLRTQTGYIRTPGYPNNYPALQKCTTTITVHPTQRLKLHVVELDMESGPEGCSDLLYVQGSFRTSSLCGSRTHDQVFTTVGNTLNLTFTSDTAGRNKGFWLSYEAFPYMEPTTPSPTTTPTSTSRALTSPVVSPSVKHKTNSVTPPGSNGENELVVKDGGDTAPQEQQGRLPLEAIVGGLLGSLLCILLVLLILLIIKRRKERESIPSSTSTCFLHSKGGTVGRGRAPYIQNNLAMVDDSPMC